MVKPIYLFGSEVLREVAVPVDLSGKEYIDNLVADLKDTLAKAEGCGLAAPQIGESVRVLIVDGRDMADIYPYLEGFTRVMINPEITYTEGTQESSEGCLSVPGYMGLVDRPEKIRIRAMDLEGVTHEYEFEGFEATVFCHENDHLDGILYSDIAKEFMTVEEYSERLEAVKAEHEAEATAE